MERDDLIQAEVEQKAADFNVKPEEVEVFDIENLKPIEHNWVKRGLRYTCESKTHPRHYFMAKS